MLFVCRTRCGGLFGLVQPFAFPWRRGRPTRVAGGELKCAVRIQAGEVRSNYLGSYSMQSMSDMFLFLWSLVKINILMDGYVPWRCEVVSAGTLRIQQRQTEL